MAWIKSNHGHSSGKGLSLFSVADRKKVQVKNPIFVKHIHPRGETIVASNGKRVHQIVHHKR